MESTYHKQTSRRRTAVRGSGRTKKGRSVSLAPRECRRLAQLCVCAVVFVAVFLGRGIFPQRLEAVQGELLSVIRTDTDFKATFAELGRAIDRGEPVVDTLENLWVSVFSGSSTGELYVPGRRNTPLYLQERAYIASNPTSEQVLKQRLGVTLPEPAPVQEQVAPIQEVEPAQETLPPVPTPVPTQVYTGPALPENATMEHLPLGLTETATPVMAVVSSAYGWREHPIEGIEKFHAGVDLAGNYGESIGAFADGVVDYIGESPAYGLYLQLRHTGGVTSFYAHCSKLCVQQGQQIKRGEKVAEVGDTGEVTGAHLHFELKLNGELLNPAYYIETE